MSGMVYKKANNQRWLFAWATCWPIFAFLSAFLSGYRIVMTTEIAGMLETDDIPVFRFFQDYLDMLAWGVVGCAGLCLISCGCLYRKLGSSWRGLSLWAVMVTCGVLTGGDAIWALTDRVNFEATKAASFFDWFRIMAFPLAGLLFLTIPGVRHWAAA